MSIVGPRPLLVRDVAYMDAQQHRRHEVRPGLTGLAQVTGRNALDWDTKLALDVSYVQRVTLAGDLKILFATVGKVVRREQVAFETEGYDMDLKDWNEMKAQKQRERETIQC
jgi:undecaprenyl phosphate N,N'-diacetylbacillosamine 1-phosphate transferase